MVGEVSEEQRAQRRDELQTQRVAQAGGGKRGAQLSFPPEPGENSHPPPPPPPPMLYSLRYHTHYNAKALSLLSQLRIHDQWTKRVKRTPTGPREVTDRLHVTGNERKAATEPSVW